MTDLGIKMRRFFVNLFIAIKLKEKGFEEPCIAEFHDGQFTVHGIETIENGHPVEALEFNTYTNISPNHFTGDNYSAPTWDQVIEWFRVVKNIDITIMPVFREKCGYDSFKRDGYTFTVLQIKPCQYLTWDDFNQCAEDRDEEEKEPDEPKCLKPSFKDYGEARIKAIESALTLI